MTVVLLEGKSDRIALEVIARRTGMVLPQIVVIGGAHAAARISAEVRQQLPHERIIGLVDAGERRAFEAAVTQIFVCDRDLEDELIRALGTDGALRVIEAQGELGSFRTLQKQPAQRDQSLLDQIRQMLNGRSGNKQRYAALFAEATPLDRIPAPLLDVLAAANEP